MGNHDSRAFFRHFRRNVPGGMDSLLGDAKKRNPHFCIVECTNLHCEWYCNYLIYRQQKETCRIFLSDTVIKKIVQYYLKTESYTSVVLMLNAAFLRISGNRRDQKIVGGNVMEKTDRSGKSRWSKLSAKKRRG